MYCVPHLDDVHARAVAYAHRQPVLPRVQENVLAVYDISLRVEDLHPSGTLLLRHGKQSEIFPEERAVGVADYGEHFLVSQMETVHRLLPEPLNPAGQKTVRFPATLLPLYDTLGIVEAFHLHGDLILQQLVDPVQMGLRFLVTE